MDPIISNLNSLNLAAAVPASKDKKMDKNTSASDDENDVVEGVAGVAAVAAVEREASAPWADVAALMGSDAWEDRFEAVAAARRAGAGAGGAAAGAGGLPAGLPAGLFAFLAREAAALRSRSSREALLCLGDVFAAGGGAAAVASDDDVGIVQRRPVAYAGAYVASARADEPLTYAPSQASSCRRSSSAACTSCASSRAPRGARSTSSASAATRASSPRSSSTRFRGAAPRARSSRGPRRAAPSPRATSAARSSVDSNHWFGGSPPNFRTLYLGHIGVDSADFWTNRLLSSSSRSTAKESGPNRSITRTLKSG